jgi:signal transduction histidine kinase
MQDIGVRLDQLAPQLQTLDDNDPAAREVRKLVGEHLPELINGYKRIPDSLRHKEHAGKTPAQQLVDGLKTIDREIETMTGQISRGELDKLAVRGRYLEIRYDNAAENGQGV